MEPFHTRIDQTYYEYGPASCYGTDRGTIDFNYVEGEPTLVNSLPETSV